VALATAWPVEVAAVAGAVAVISSVVFGASGAGCAVEVGALPSVVDIAFLWVFAIVPLSPADGFATACEFDLKMACIWSPISEPASAANPTATAPTQTSALNSAGVPSASSVALSNTAAKAAAS
jgi:hypothetical protein